MTRTHIVLAVLIGGCARAGFGTGTDGRSGPLVDARIEDAASDQTTRCVYGTSGWVLGDIEPVDELNSAGWDGELWLRPDGLSAILASDRDVTLGYRLYQTSRDQPTAPFREPHPLEIWPSDLSPVSDASLSETADGLTAALVSNYDSTGHLIWIGHRETTSETWSWLHFTRAAEVNALWREAFDAFVSPDGLRLYYAPVAADTGQNLVVAERASVDDDFGSGVALAGVNSDHPDADPTLSADGRLLIFDSRRPDGGDKDLYYALRTSVDAPFSKPMLMPEPINSPHDDGEAFLSHDGCELYFASDRPGSLDIYRAKVLEGP